MEWGGAEWKTRRLDRPEGGVGLEEEAGGAELRGRRGGDGWPDLQSPTSFEMLSAARSFTPPRLPRQEARPERNKQQKQQQQQQQQKDDDIGSSNEWTCGPGFNSRTLRAVGGEAGWGWGAAGAARKAAPKTYGLKRNFQRAV